MNVYENLDLKNLSGEIWKPIREYPDYQISNFGRVKSFKRYHGTNERILKQIKTKKGYLRVDLSYNKSKKVHVLVFETFNNYKLKDDECVHHDDEIKINNFVDNLVLITMIEHNRLSNIGHVVSKETRTKISEKKKGTHHSEKTKKILSEKSKGKNNGMFEVHRPGENHPSHKLLNKDICDIRKSLELKLYTPKQLSWMFDVSVSTIYDINMGRSWS